MFQIFNGNEENMWCVKGKSQSLVAVSSDSTSERQQIYMYVAFGRS